MAVMMAMVPQVHEVRLDVDSIVSDFSLDAFNASVASARFLVKTLRTMFGAEPTGTKFNVSGRFTDGGVAWVIRFIYDAENVDGARYASRLPSLAR